MQDLLHGSGGADNDRLCPPIEEPPATTEEGGRPPATTGGVRTVARNLRRIEDGELDGGRLARTAGSDDRKQIPYPDGKPCRGPVSLGGLSSLTTQPKSENLRQSNNLGHQLNHYAGTWVFRKKLYLPIEFLTERWPGEFFPFLKKL